MPDRLVRRMPPMANEWTMGLATGQAIDPANCGELAAAIRAKDPDRWEPLIDPVVLAIEHANSSYFRFALDGAMEGGEPSIVRMERGVDTRALGLGLVSSHSTRKVTILAVLACGGGPTDLALEGFDKATQAQPGKIIMFPSFMVAALCGADDGWLEAAAFHAYGPAFR